MHEKKVDITQKYSHKIQDIKNKLNQHEEGRIYELSRAQMDGYLATNIEQLKKMIANLIHKIEYGEDSINEKIFDAIDKLEI